MAKIVNNDKEFKVISLSDEEAASIGFGIWYRNDEDTDDLHSCICIHCNNTIKEDIYYIAVLNDVMDKECYDRWYKGATRYTEDIPIENRNFNYYREALGL